MVKERVKLTTSEHSELIAEGLVTVVLLLLLNLSVVILINWAILTDKSLENNIYVLKQNITFLGHHIWSWQNIFLTMLGLFDLLVVYWRLIRRYHQMQLRHIISELHYIANGHFDHRIPFNVRPDLQHVIDSINALVDSTVDAIEEERKIEQSKDDLVTNVSHDIRTPLTSIIGYLGLLKDAKNLSAEDANKYVNIAYQKAEQMKSLADDLFEFQTLKSPNAKLKLTTFNVKSLLDQIAAGFELEAEKQQIQFEVNVSPEQMHLQADAEKLVRLFSNLISNAFKYGHTTTKIQLSAVKKSSIIELRVENDGQPIPQDKVDRIFERFYRVESSRNVATGGTGLGLSIVKGIVDLHRGHIHCESSSELTSFIIELPITQTA